MAHLTRHSLAKQVSITDSRGPRTAALLAERERLKEEVRQLRAAVQIYAEIVRRLETDGEPGRAA